MTGSFPRQMSSGMTPALPVVKAPTVTPQEPSVPAITAPKVKGTLVGLKKPKPPSASMRRQNGM